MSLAAGRWAVCLALISALSSAQTPQDSNDPIRVGPGVTPPRLLRKIEPEYSSEARAARAQGTVILYVVVNTAGRATDISVISPLGFGLDEQAQATVARWQFDPGRKDGRPVNVAATIEVNFRFPEARFDEKLERQRTNFNVALQTLKRERAPSSPVDGAVKSMLDLSHQKYAPAMYVEALWKLEGSHGPRDAAAGLELLRKAAEKSFGPALYEMAIRRIEGRDLAPDAGKGWSEMRSAATLGSKQAQAWLGRHYEAGEGVERDAERARRYYRLCAAQDEAQCQYRLARMLYETRGRQHDYLQAIALFGLAAKNGVADAKEAAENEEARLTPQQQKWVTELRQQIVRK